MIVLAIITVAILFIGLATAAVYFSEQSKISQKQEESAQVQNDRVKEEIEAILTLDGDLNMKNASGVESNIVGLMVKCDDGTIHTGNYTLTVPPGAEPSPSDRSNILGMLAKLETDNC